MGGEKGGSIYLIYIPDTKGATVFSVFPRLDSLLWFHLIFHFFFFFFSLNLGATDICCEYRPEGSSPVTFWEGTATLENLSLLGILPTVKLKLLYSSISLITEILILLFEHILGNNCFCWRNIFIISYIILLFLWVSFGNSYTLSPAFKNDEQTFDNRLILVHEGKKRWTGSFYSEAWLCS